MSLKTGTKQLEDIMIMIIFHCRVESQFLEPSVFFKKLFPAPQSHTVFYASFLKLSNFFFSNYPIFLTYFHFPLEVQEIDIPQLYVVVQCSCDHTSSCSW